MPHANIPQAGLSMWDVPIDEAVYTFVDGATGEPTHIAASTLRKALEGAKATPVLAIIAPGLEEALRRGDCGVEEPHALTLPEAALEVPGIVGAWGDQHVIIDGAHRLWRRWKRGDKDFPAYYVPEALWRAFVIRDMPGDGAFWDFFNKNVQVRGL